MTKPLLGDAFAHHVWATRRLLDTCLTLREEQLGTSVPGTYGSILDTMRHLVDGDAGYLIAMTGEDRYDIDTERMSLGDLRATVEVQGAAWTRVLASDLDPDTVLVRRWDDGSETQTTIGIRIAQALHHGTDHRSQVCTALTTLGVEPPGIDVWAYADQAGRLVELQPGDRPKSLRL